MTHPLRIRIIALLVVLMSLIVNGLYWWQLSTADHQLRSETVAQAQLRSRQLNGAVADQIALLIRYTDLLRKNWPPGMRASRKSLTSLRARSSNDFRPTRCFRFP
ncbi:hypothetical protein [Propionivibrio sp.]|uniref:hypothetical protein n=1 Tax=Propionivibrio sp. TaxID=2212460 RepID=UPI003BEFA87C